jgi:hypothetical protein
MSRLCDWPTSYLCIFAAWDAVVALMFRPMFG